MLPDERQVSAEIEVTPEMIEAGSAELALTNPLIFVDSRVAVIRACCVAASTHVGLEHRYPSGE